MSRDVFTKYSDQKCVNDFRLVVRNAIVEPFVEREQMARSAGIRKFHRCHQLAASCRTSRPQSIGVKRQKFVAIFVADGCGTVLRVGVSQVRVGGDRAMAVATFELNGRTVWFTANRLHVNGVIQLDRTGVACGDARNGTQRGELRMAALEASDVKCVVRSAGACPQVAVAFSASLIAGGGDILAAAVFRVARFAGRSRRLRGVVYGPVVAGEASVVGSLRRKCASLLRVTGSAFFFEDGVRFREVAAAVNARVFENGAFGNPEEREQGKQEAEPEFGALERRRPLEIVEVDALREFLRCA